MVIGGMRTVRTRARWVGGKAKAKARRQGNLEIALFRD